MPIIKTKEQWWEVVDKYWEYLQIIISDFLDMRHMSYEIPGDDKSKTTGRTIFEEINYLKEHRNEKLNRYFAYSWCAASDAYAYSKYGWCALCDLCSENWVFQEDPPDGYYGGEEDENNVGN